MLPVLPMFLALGACAGSADDSGATTEGSFVLTSDAFVEGGALPADLKCERDGGDGASPPLAWSGPPAGTGGFALTMTHYPNPDDTVTPPNSYWLLWNLPAELRALSRGNVESVGTEGSDKDGVGTGYTPPCAPDAGEAVHTYTITLFALSEAPELGDDDSVDVTWEAVVAAIDGLTEASASISFTN